MIEAIGKYAYGGGVGQAGGHLRPKIETMAVTEWRFSDERWWVSTLRLTRRARRRVAMEHRRTGFAAALLRITDLHSVGRDRTSATQRDIEYLPQIDRSSAERRGAARLQQN